MKKRLFISFTVHLLLGILFVFPAFSAEGFCHEQDSRFRIGYFGGEDDSDPSVSSAGREAKVSGRKFQKKTISLLKRVDIPFFSFHSSKANSLLKHWLKRTGQTVSVSYLESLRSIVILC